MEEKKKVIVKQGHDNLLDKLAISALNGIKPHYLIVFASSVMAQKQSQSATHFRRQCQIYVVAMLKK